MKKHLLILVTILMSALMICSCAVAPSTSTDSGVDDSSTNSDTGGDTNGDGGSTNDGVGDSTNDDITNDDITNDDTTNDDTTNDDNVSGDTTNDDDVNDDNTNDDTTNDDTTNDNTNNDGNDNVNDGNNGDLGNEEPPKEEKPQVNIATQINDAYYKRIYGRYKGDDFPEEYGCYYKVIATYEEFKELFSAVDDPGRAFFNHYYAVIIYEHYVTNNHSSFVGYRDWVGRNITAVYSDALGALYPQGSSIKNSKSCIAIPKSKNIGENGKIYEINIKTEYLSGYRYDIGNIPIEKVDNAKGGAWLAKSNEEFKAICGQFGLKAIYNIDSGDGYVLVFYSDMYCINYIEFRDFYTDGKNVYLTCEKVATPNPSSEEKPSIYFVVIPKSLIEHEMSDEIVMHFLHQKS